MNWLVVATSASYVVWFVILAELLRLIMSARPDRPWYAVLVRSTSRVVWTTAALCLFAGYVLGDAQADARRLAIQGDTVLIEPGTALLLVGGAAMFVLMAVTNVGDRLTWDAAERWVPWRLCARFDRWMRWHGKLTGPRRLGQ